MKRVTVFLLVDTVNPADALDTTKRPETLSLDPASGWEGAFYYTKSFPSPPAWLGFISPYLTSVPAQVLSASSSGLLILKAHGSFFAFTFGYGKSLLDPTKIVQQFGLRVALNRVDPAQIRSMDTKTFEDMVVTRNTQTSKSSDIPNFGIDVSRDILRAVTGEPRDPTFAKRISGSDALVLTFTKDVTDLPAKCKEVLDAYRDTAYKADFDWIDHMSVVPAGRRLDELNSLLVKQLARGDASNTHMAMPEPTNWEDIDAFRISGTFKTEYDDLDLPEYLAGLSAKKLRATNLETLKSRRVSARYSRGGSDFLPLWTLYQCLVSEQRIGGELFVLIEGRWFQISDTLVKRVDAFVSALPTSRAALGNAKPGEIEPDFNRRLAAEKPDDFLSLDAKIKRPGGASSGIEFCDLLTADRELIHVKRKSRSSTLSHLFAQGAVSTTTFIDDPTFRDEVRDLISAEAPAADVPRWLALVPDGATPVAKSTYTVSYVVLAKSTATGIDWLPFFSRLNLMQQGRQIKNLGFEVAITRIDN